MQSQQSGGDIGLVEGITEVLEKTGQVDGGAFWRHRPGRNDPPGSIGEECRSWEDRLFRLSHYVLPPELLDRQGLNLERLGCTTSDECTTFDGR